MKRENDRRWWDLCCHNMDPVDQSALGVNRPDNSCLIMGSGCFEANVGTSQKSELETTRSRVEDIVEVDTGSL